MSETSVTETIDEQNKPIDEFNSALTEIVSAYLDNPRNLSYMDKICRAAQQHGVDGVEAVKAFDEVCNAQRIVRAAKAAQARFDTGATW